MKIGDRAIGAGEPPYVIAEIGVNHDGSAERAIELTEAAAGAGAHGVKLQYFETDRLMSGAAKLAAYQKAAGETDPVSMLRRLELSLDACAKVIERAHACGVHALVSIFSVELVGPVLELPWDGIKSASPDVINRPLLDAMAADGRPMIVSTGAATLDEVVRAAGWLGEAGTRDRLAMLQCVSSYPAPDLALGGIGAIARATGLPVGYSDHTESVETGGLAVAAGACVLERHLTYDRAAQGPDHAASLEPGAFAEYVRLATSAERAHDVGNAGGKTVLDCERDVRHVSRQSLVTTREIAAGAVIGRDDLTIKRPGTGLEPFRLEETVGRTARRAIAADRPIGLDDLV